MKTRECENCGHPVESDHGFQRVMLGDCSDCPECRRDDPEPEKEPEPA